jgi:hypothetical protein
VGRTYKDINKDQNNRKFKERNHVAVVAKMRNSAGPMKSNKTRGGASNETRELLEEVEEIGENDYLLDEEENEFEI